MNLNFVCLTALVVILIAAVDIHTVLQNADREVGQEESPRSVTAYDLGTHYELNVIRADSYYKDRVIMVTGPVRNIGRHPINGIAFVQLSTVNKEAWDAGNDDLAKRNVNCYFSKDRESEAERLYSRQPEARLAGKVVGADSFEIMLIGCRLFR